MSKKFHINDYVVCIDKNHYWWSAPGIIQSYNSISNKYTVKLELNFNFEVVTDLLPNQLELIKIKENP